MDNNILLEKLNKYFSENLKLSFISHRNIILVTKDDRVYEFSRVGFKTVRYPLIVMNDENEKIRSIVDESIVEELCHKQIIDFRNGTSFTIARSIDGKIYSWSGNLGVPLGDGRHRLETEKPQMNQYLKDKIIVDMCCGSDHQGYHLSRNVRDSHGINYFS